MSKKHATDIAEFNPDIEAVIKLLDVIPVIAKATEDLIHRFEKVAGPEYFELRMERFPSPNYPLDAVSEAVDRAYNALKYAAP
jgi:hypothetical protein